MIDQTSAGEQAIAEVFGKKHLKLCRESPKKNMLNVNNSQ